ncbi:EF-hand domain-containing protein [Celeribacter baekdonensis]|nr:EF-hand domain-containing protein [Celeribacter baekdonensis]
MKRNTFVSALAFVAVLGGSVAAFAAGGPNTPDQMGGMRGGMKTERGQGFMPFGPEFDFATVDTDGDGKLSMAEMDAFKAARFAEVDADGNGTVDAAELMAHHEAQRMARMQARVETMIKNRDTNGDGVLSAEEMSNAPRVSLFDRLDQDDDGMISQEELALMQQRMQGHMKDDGRPGMKTPGQGRN